MRLNNKTKIALRGTNDRPIVPGCPYCGSATAAVFPEPPPKYVKLEYKHRLHRKCVKCRRPVDVDWTMYGDDSNGKGIVMWNVVVQGANP